eukprot:6458319-Amphidinium_carterae.2
MLRPAGMVKYSLDKYVGSLYSPRSGSINVQATASQCSVSCATDYTGTGESAVAHQSRMPIFRFICRKSLHVRLAVFLRTSLQCGILARLRNQTRHCNKAPRT